MTNIKKYPEKWWLMEENKNILKRLNIGCGNRQLPMTEGWINLDIDHECSPDIVRDLRRGLPFNDNYFVEVLASHVLEHLEPDDVFFILREIHRVCKEGATLRIVEPYWQSKGFFDIDHKSFITPRSFALFMKKAQDVTVQNNRRIVQNCFWEPEEVIDDLNGKIHAEPQTYMILRADKSELGNFNYR